MKKPVKLLPVACLKVHAGGLKKLISQDEITNSNISQIGALRLRTSNPLGQGAQLQGDGKQAEAKKRVS